MEALETQAADLSRLTTLEFMGLLQSRRIHIHANGERLRVSAPAGAIDSSLQAELTRRKKALLSALAQEEAASALLPLDAETLRGRLPLTPAQQGIWLISHFDPDNVAYNIPEAFRLERSSSLETFQAAVDQLLARHRVLRASFHEEDGELFQTIDPTGRATVGFTDLSTLSVEESDRRCREQIREEGRRPFDLSQAPLARFHLFHFGQHRCVVFSNIHHIIADRISLYVLRKELIALCESISRHEDAALPPVPIQSADYAVWMAGNVHREAVKKQLDYWKKKLVHLGDFVELPHSLPRPEKRSSWGATRPLTVPKADRVALARIGMEEGASPFMTFLAVFALLIARVAVSGGNDFCVGSPITSRKHPATEEMIGLFVNMLIFRCEIRPGQNFRQVLRAVRSMALEAYDNSDAPFQSVVKALKPDRKSQRSPVFQIMFGYETYLPVVANELQMDTDPGTARYDLSLHLAETKSDGLSGCFEYCTDLFTDTDVAELASSFVALVAAVSRDTEHDALSLDTRSQHPTE